MCVGMLRIFTFQSGHIPMGNTSLGSQVIPNFTFQSGHIPIGKTIAKVQGSIPLHSNLVIFQLKVPPTKPPTSLLYIPIWSYSNNWLRYNHN